MQTLTKEQFEKLYGTQTVKQFSKIQPSGETSFGADAIQDIKQTGSNLVNTAKTTFRKQKEALSAGIEGKQGLFRSLGQAFGIGAGGVAQGLGDVVTGAVKTVLPQGGEDIVKSGIGAVAKPIVESDFVQNIMSKYDSLDENQKRDVDALLGVGSLASELVGGSLAKKPLTSTIKKSTELASKAVTGAGELAMNVTKPVANVVGNVIDTTKLAGQGAMRIPERIATNIAEKKATQQAINSLPSTYAKKAVQDGIDIRDINTLYSIPKEQKQVVSKLVKHVQDFEAGKAKTDPMELVGKPIVNRLKTLQSRQAIVGKKLGEVSKQLGNVTEQDTFPTVYNSLKSTRGLEGLRLAEDGSLDFSNTVLATAETASDRNAIQSIFDDAVKAGTGEQKHLLRQELRESLGGKKRGGVQLTGTQENAYEAIRKGLSDVLDSKNPAYKAINQQYAKLANPVSELTKLLKVGNETSDDVLNLSAGVLARRLTSASTGNAKIRQLLQLVDKATKVKGKTLTSTETLQNVINVLGRYYDIAPRTGFKNLTQEAVSGGVKDFVSGAVTDIAGRTDAVRKKALEEVFKDLLSN